MNDFYKGKLALLEELTQFCEHQREKIKAEAVDPDIYKRCTKSGVLSAYATMIQRLKAKQEIIQRNESQIKKES